MANSKENRIATINDVFGNGKFISLSLPNGLNPGATISICLDSGELKVVNSHADEIETPDEIETQIKEQGHIKNAHLYRRWVMAQMFRMLNWDPRWTSESGYDGYLHTNHNYKYQFEVIENELNAMAHMEKENDPELATRSFFWTKEVIAKTLIDHAKRVKRHARSNMRWDGCYQYCKMNKDYVRWSDVEDRARILVVFADSIRNAETYAEQLRLFRNAREYVCVLNPTTALCPEWKDAYKGAGAYYTLQNLIRYHGVGIKDEAGNLKYGASAEAILESKRLEYEGNGYRLFYMMKDVVEYNHFDFDRRMREVYSNR